MRAPAVFALVGWLPDATLKLVIVEKFLLRLPNYISSVNKAFALVNGDNVHTGRRRQITVLSAFAFQVFYKIKKQIVDFKTQNFSNSSSACFTENFAYDNFLDVFDKTDAFYVQHLQNFK